MNYSRNLLIALFALSAAINAQSTASSLPTGCLVMDPSNIYCMSCDHSQLYYLSKANCVRCGVQSCDQISPAGNCIACKQGYYLRQGLVCVVVTMIPGCITYSTTAPTSVCLACNPNTMLVNGVCLPTVANCTDYIPGTNLCAHCADGFTQSQDWASCIPGGISYCNQFDCLGLCVQCNTDLPRLSSNRNLCLIYIPYCLPISLIKTCVELVSTVTT